LFAVGDDDQAIYGFRGADIGNILRFQNDYPGCRILKLEWNYRSTPQILEVANRIFLDKPMEFRKKLRPGSGRNDPLFRQNLPVMLKEFHSPMEEMEWIALTIRQTRAQFGIPYKAFAILVRYHLQREWYVLSLESVGIPILKADMDGVQIETIHASKGLQYPVVFYAGLAEGISPAKSEGKRDAVLRQREEERRLFYVGVTRAECQLYLLFCKRRHWRGKLCEFRKSPFLECLPRKDRKMNNAKIIVVARIVAYMAWSMVLVFWKRIRNPQSVASWVESRLAAWAKFCLHVNGYVHTIEGQQHLAQVDWSRPVFVVSNHQSYMDIPVVLVTMDHKLGFIAKHELSRIPFLGFWMKKIGCLLIQRGKAGVGVDVANAIKKMGSAPNIVVFPEGTRSRNGKMSPFKSGAFRMAMDHHGILVPMVLIGSRDGWEKRKEGCKVFSLHSKILAPIDCEALLKENPQATHKDLMQTVRSAMENAL
jgi:1-acyl-sn-glycerol-3-phosphate acyltransferase